MSLEKTFTDIYKKNSWKGSESVSGQGSSLEQTAAIREMLPWIMEALGIESFLDIPCGDFSWMAKIPPVKLGKRIKYIGADIVPEIIETNRAKHIDAEFRVIDLVNDPLPIVDMVFCRDCLGHLTNANVRKALKNIKASGAKYLMATTFYDPKWDAMADINDGEWRPINLIKHFGLGQPLLLVSEECWIRDGQFSDKSMGVWKIN